MAEKKQDDRRPKGDTGTTDIYTAKMGNPPMDPDMGSVPKYLKEKRPAPPITASEVKTDKKAAGGSIRSASSRADGIAQRGKTRA